MTTTPEPLDKGDVLPSGVTPVANRTGEPIPVLTAEQWSDLARTSRGR